MLPRSGEQSGGKAEGVWSPGISHGGTEQTAGKRVLARLEKTKGNIPELGVRKKTGSEGRWAFLVRQAGLIGVKAGRHWRSHLG